MALATLGVYVASTWPAIAHSPIKGIGTFYNGALHPILVPAQLLALLGTGLLIGQHAPHASRAALPAFTLALVAGFSSLALLPTHVSIPPAALLAVALFAALAVALAPTLGKTVPVVVAIAAGLLIGLDSLPEGIPEQQHWVAYGGAAFGTLLAATYLGGLAAWFRRPWQKIAIRVLGSWTAASAFLGLILELALPSVSA